MRKMILVTGLLFLLQTTFNVSNVFAEYSIDDYYPTNQGNAWAYDVTRSNFDGSDLRTESEGAYISGFETVRYPDGREYTGYKYWWWNGRYGNLGYNVERLTTTGLEGIKDAYSGYSLYGTADSTEPNQPTMWFPRTFDVGTQGDISYKTYSYTHAGVLGGVTLNREHYNVLGFENVTVPAGTFNNALKLTFTEISPGDGEDWVTTIYFGKGVGEIKWDELTSYVNGSPNQIQRGVLTSYTVTPEPISCALFLLGGGALALARRRKKLLI